MLTVWGRKSSSNVQALMWCIGELGLEYKRHDIGHRFGGTDTDEFFALNPNRTVPVIKDGSNPPLWETGAVLRYLASRYSNNDFWPTDLLAKTEVDRWAEWSKINIALSFTAPIFWQVVRTAKKDQYSKKKRTAIDAFEDKLVIAEVQLKQNKFIAGPNLTLADIQFGHVLFRYFDIDIERKSFPRLEEYYNSLSERKAYREHVMLPYDELRVD